MKETPFSERIDWIAVTLPFVVWAAHFSLLWGANSAFPGDPAARWIALAATLTGLAALVRLRTARAHRGPQAMPRLSYMLAGVAMLFGALPALVG